MNKPLTPSEMGKKSWESRQKKYGKKGALKMLKEFSIKGGEARKLTIPEK